MNECFVLDQVIMAPGLYGSRAAYTLSSIVATFLIAGRLIEDASRFPARLHACRCHGLPCSKDRLCTFCLLRYEGQVYTWVFEPLLVNRRRSSEFFFFFFFFNSSCGIMIWAAVRILPRIMYCLPFCFLYTFFFFFWFLVYLIHIH